MGSTLGHPLRTASTTERRGDGTGAGRSSTDGSTFRARIADRTAVLPVSTEKG
ncbi:hypothetical protein ACFVXQ_08810 [Kitasatospora sp. NPDC058263]